MEGDIREECGLFGCFGVPDAARQTLFGLYAQQHRGQESAGIVAGDGTDLRSVKRLGLAMEALNPRDLRALTGDRAVGHVRYSTTGAQRVQNIQPLVVHYSRGILAIAHNGNLVNARTLRHDYESRGSIFQTSTDSEVIVHLMADPACLSSEDPLVSALGRVKGAYCFLILTDRALHAARDPYGFRPLSLGTLDGGWVVASETCAFDTLGAEFVRDVEPGEVVTIDAEGLRSARIAPRGRRFAHCIFEHIYFARPDSVVFGDTVHNVRYRLGENLAHASPAAADIVTAIPDSGNSPALGFAHAAGIPFQMGFVRNIYVGRTFIAPSSRQRKSGVNLKLNVVREVVKGRDLVVVDDSIVRGNTCRNRLDLLRRAGAKSIHMRIAAPPIRHPCFYGIDFPTQRELIAHEHTVEEIAAAIKVDTLAYQTIEGLLSAVSRPGDYCTACFSGDYPTEFEAGMEDKYALDRGGALEEEEEKWQR